MRRVGWVAAALLAGCATMTNDWSSVHPADPKPAEDEARTQAEAAIRYVMKDPDSAQFRNWSPVYKTLTGLAMTPVWGICVEVNGKNSYGGMTGFTPMTVEFAKPPVAKEAAYGCSAADLPGRQ